MKPAASSYALSANITAYSAGATSTAAPLTGQLEPTRTRTSSSPRWFRRMGPEHWEPRYLDYLYTSFTNVMAFSPPDTMPLSRWAKSLMALQSAIALLTNALVLARAVIILK